MFAIVEVAGQQFKVEKDSKLFVHRLDEKEGDKIFLDKVLLIDNEGKVKIGTPLVSNARISATVLSHLKGDKVKVFKKKRRKGYQVLNGHRQYFTEIVINTIEEKVTAAEKKATATTTSTAKKAAATQKLKTTSAKPSKETEAKGGTKTKATAKSAITKATTVKTKPAGTKTTASKEVKEVKAKKPGTKTTAKNKTKES